MNPVLGINDMLAVARYFLHFWVSNGSVYIEASVTCLFALFLIISFIVS